nr:hypothetical protein [uncultured Halomonas sp.]
MNKLPFIFNLVIYPDRDASLYQDMCNMPSKYRAERLRKLASLALVLPPMVGALDVRMLGSVAPDDSDHNQGGGGSDNIDVKVTINSYTHHELFNDIAAMPKGHVSQRIKLLAEAGLIYQRLSGALTAGKGGVVTKGSVTTPLAPQEAAQPEAAQQPLNVEPANQGALGEDKASTKAEVEVEAGKEKVGQEDEAPARESLRRRSSFDGVKM